jgi:hypothetical protein
MMFSPNSPWLVAVLGVTALTALGCEPGGVGDPCIPEEEYQTLFGGFGETEASAETKSFQCLTRVCLVNHFRGRASCPYGQAALPPPPAGQPPPVRTAAQADCFVPGTDGSDDNDVIQPAVAPQFVDRQKDKAVYCSCRCDGPSENARYCECPSGFSCTELIPSIGLGKEELAGSYCVKDGTQYNAQSPPTQDCTPDNQGGGDCGPANL